MQYLVGNNIAPCADIWQQQMCSYPSAASTPYRIPLIPPSQCSYISDFNQSLGSPNSRRVYAMQKRQPFEADTNNSVDVVLDSANANRVKYSMAVLVILSLSSLLFTSFGLYILSIYLSFPLTYESGYSSPDDSLSTCKVQYARVTSEIVVASAVISTISSLTTFFVTAIQLIVVLRMLKRSTSVLNGVLGYINNGRALRFIAYSGWILSFASFTFGFALYLLVLSCQVGFVSQVTGAAFGVFCLLICAISCLHTAYALWSKRFRISNDEKDGHKSDLSTLV